MVRLPFEAQLRLLWRLQGGRAGWCGSRQVFRAPQACVLWTGEAKIRAPGKMVLMVGVSNLRGRVRCWEARGGLHTERDAGMVE